MRKRTSFLLLILPLLGFALLSGHEKMESPARAKPFAPITLDAADSLLARLGDDERIAQLLVVRDTQPAEPYVGGFLFDSPEQGKNRPFLDPNGVPYFVGLNMLKDESQAFFPASQLAATNDPALVQSYASALGMSLKKNGFNFVVGPSLEVAAIDDESDDPGCFSDDPEVVITYAKAFVSGMQQAKVLAVAGSASHWPAASPEQSEDHLATPLNQLANKELSPYKALINHGLTSVMFNTPVNAAATPQDTAPLLPLPTHTILRDRMGFNGLAWSDLSASNADASEVVALLNQGADVLIVNDLPSSIDAIEEAVANGMIDRATIDRKCKRILQSKLWSERSLKHKEQSPAALELNHREVIRQSMVLLQNNDRFLPFTSLDSLRPVIVEIAAEPNPELPELARRYANVDVHRIRIDHLEADLSAFKKLESEYNAMIIIAEPEADQPRRRFGIGEHYQSVIDRLAYSQPTAFVWKGKSKAMEYVASIPSLKSIVLSHRDEALSDDYITQLVFGGRAFSGQTKRRIGEFFPRHAGLNTEKIRLAYGIPEEVGIDRTHLEKVDQIVAEAMEVKACPGAQVWFAKDGVVVVNEAYGYHTYEEKDTVRHNDLYDLASITKIAGSVAGLMRLQQQGLFNLDHNLCDYLGEAVDTTEYMNMSIREILAHQAGLPAFIPFYQQTVKKGVPRYDIYSLAQSETYPYRVATELYIHKDQPEKMFRQILNHKIKTDKKYKYSDVGYYFMKRIIEQQSGLPMEDYLEQEYYAPLGMWTMGYRPLERFDKRQITPTEYDRFFRNQLVHGDVHDPGSAMMGGVGGHAGLFSNANDLGKMMQMYLNGGTYGGRQYFDSTIINDYTACQFCDNDNRRGAGFDKPLLDGSEGPSCGCTSLDAFGHQGFTGTVTWADPGEEVVYVFLSNRVYPNADNRKLASMNIRTNIQKAFYEAIELSRSAAEGAQL